MNYGLYLSASGVMTNSYRQDVIANNLANAETVGFKRDLALFQERRTALQERGGAGGWSDPILENIGGGILATPTLIDSQQGDLESTDNPMDVAIQGNGYFSVSNGKEQHLTRDGRFMVNRDGNLVLTTEQGQQILDDKGKPIKLGLTGNVAIDTNGRVRQGDNLVGTIGLYDVPDRSKLTKQGGNMFGYPDPAGIHAVSGTLRSGFQERSNVDPATELAQLMDTQRQLEANANMIKYQDSMMQLLVNSVGKIS